MAVSPVACTAPSKPRIFKSSPLEIKKLTLFAPVPVKPVSASTELENSLPYSRT